jgi:large subunit ribosomal protein L25
MTGRFKFKSVDNIANGRHDNENLFYGVPMSTISLGASVRTNTGKGAARKIRSAGSIPASIYRAGNEPTLITVDPRELTLAFERTGNPNTLVDLKVEDKNFLCLVKDVQRHPASGVLRHVDFYQVDESEEIVVSVPVTIVGRSAGVAMGGALRLIRRDLNIKAKPQDIPAFIEVDVTKLEIGKFIKVDAIPSPENATIVYDESGIFNVVTVVKRRGSKK